MLKGDRALGAMLLLAAALTVPLALLLSLLRSVTPRRAARRLFGEGAPGFAGAGFAYARTPRPVGRVMGPAASAFGLVPVAVSLLARRR